MNRLNSVVIKLWLTIILIVATVLILLSVSLITFIQYYFTQETENSIKEDAKRISSLVEKSKNKSLAIQNSQKLIDGPGGLIIMKDFNDKPASSYNNTKIQMLKEIKHNDNFKKVFQKGKFETQNVTIKNHGDTQSYILLGYPMKAQKDAHGKHSGVFIYKDLKSIEDTNNAITIIILITAIIFIAASTIFAFFLSNKITKPLRQLKTQAQKVSEGDYSHISSVKTKDEIGDLSRAFNNMNYEIQEHIEALSSSKNIRDSLINSMVEGVLGINDQRDVIISNKMADEIIHNIDDFSKELIEKQIEQTFKSEGTEFQEIEINTRYYVFITSYINRIQPNGRNGIVVIIRDMTNEHNLDQMKKDFIANVSHELRTPISLLQGYTESIVDGVVTEPDEIRDSLAVVLDESKRLNRLVNELLNVARMDAEGLSVEKEVQPIDDLLDKMKAKYRMQAEDLDLTMEFNSGNDNQMWDYDMDRMDQVLTNLIDNASRYTQPGDTIAVTTAKDNRYNILYISDTGTGIAPEHLQQVFDRFYKVDASRKRGKQGTGLGLFICKMIIEEHGGKIEVESELGKGTTFIIKLPQPHIENN
ncbi:ATP-binding protein [Staphylococcus caprae]|uniref:ATP-binding protein n=1 Tax=Staphylococcus caprae TaxID=29380 RepID=UPI000E67751D|nr:ATP-binding protein [Staphylococcus caprae]MBU5270901.1 HAMP domain-containing protein [Staphylococcus caprae]MDK6297457.1 ATP-binding protein [Staphylococcus caprae]MDK7233111.1 ATP-binding protein [Staphylococcus caprae]RIM36172.1 HAMP domain-containing protein [Staphylococcus caprae]